MKFRQIGIKVTDLNRAVNFYSQILNCQPLAIFPEPGFAFYDLNGVRLFLDVNAPRSAIYLEVPNVVEFVKSLSDKGVKIVSSPHVVFPDPNGLFDKPGNEWLSFIEDSEGNNVGLMSRESKES